MISSDSGSFLAAEQWGEEVVTMSTNAADDSGHWTQLTHFHDHTLTMVASTAGALMSFREHVGPIFERIAISVATAVLAGVAQKAVSLLWAATIRAAINLAGTKKGKR